MNANPQINKKWEKEIEKDIAIVDANVRICRRRPGLPRPQLYHAPRLPQWVEWYGKLNAGPFNTDCFTWCWNGACDCRKHLQPMPPKVPPAEVD